MHIDFCLVIDFEKFMIREFGEVEFENSGIQLKSYAFTRVKTQLDGVSNLEDFKMVKVC
jgi:hypothetical protein